MATFSIIIPIYNGEQTLETCLDSVASQTFKDFELILVNDGSTDASEEIIQDWISLHLELDIKLVEQENLGLGKARNSGIEIAQGQYICFLDCDDIWTVNKLSEIAFLLKENPALKFIYHSVLEFGQQAYKKRKSYPLQDKMELLLQGNPIVPSSTVLESSLAKENPFSENLDFHGAEDLLLWFSLMEKGEAPYFLNKFLTSYRAEGGMSTRLQEHLKKVFEVLKFLKERDSISEQILNKAINRKYYEAGRFFQKRRNFSEAENYYMLAHLNNPKSMSLRMLNFLGISL
tara:strand:- start:2709 stop:3575 length:867 start_codon:yes stop_codon:yes gene_type:complete